MSGTCFVIVRIQTGRPCLNSNRITPLRFKTKKLAEAWRKRYMCWPSDYRVEKVVN